MSGISFPPNSKSSKRTTLYSVSDYGDSNDKTSLDSERSLARAEIQHDTSSSRPIYDQCRTKHSFFKPISHRTWVLTAFGLAVGLCIVLLELTISIHPNEEEVPTLDKRDYFGEIEHAFWIRQVVVTTSSSSDAAPLTTAIVSEDDGASSTAVSPTTSSVVVGSPAPDNLLAITTASGDSEVPGQPPPSDQLSITSADSTIAPNGGDQLTITSTNTQPDPQLITSTPTIGNPAPESQLSITEQNGITDAIISQTTAAALPVSVVSGSVLESAGSFITIIASSQTTIVTAADGVVITLPVGNIVLTNSDGHATATVSHPVATPTAVSTDIDSNTASDGSSTTEVSQAFTKLDYFLSMYLPTLLGVILQSVWLVVFATFKMMEPFYQLANPRGASAAMTLTADYMSTGLSLNFVKAATDGHWVMFLAGLVQLLLGIVVTLASEAMGVKPTAYCATPAGNHQPCNPVWVVNLRVVRAMEVLLVTCFSSIIMIIVLNRQRVSGVFADPTRIATLADLLSHPPLVQELRDIPASATKLQIEAELEGNRYMLGTFATEGIPQYGIIKLSVAPTERSFGKAVWYKAAYYGLKRASHDVVAGISVITDSMPYLIDVVAILLIVLLSVIILVYWSVSAGAFNDWMNSGGLEPSMFLAGLAVLIAFFVKRKEQYVRLSHPYVLLAKPLSKPARETITAGTRGQQFTSTYKSFVTQDLSLAFMSMAAILSDLLMILIPGVPFTRAQTKEVYLASTWGCLGMLFLMLIAEVRIMYKDWKMKHILNDGCPDTLASGLLRLCASQFVEQKNRNQKEEHRKEFGSIHMDFFDSFDEAHQVIRYEGQDGGRRYRFARMIGVDGITRFMVDEVFK